jgi:predicted phosphodiesterase
VIYSILNFLDVNERKNFYQEIIITGCGGVLLSGDVAEAPTIKDILKELAEFIVQPIYFVLGNHDYYRGQIIVLTHIPPFAEACLYEGKISNDDWLPYFSSKASGDVLVNICSKHPNIDFLVLCGHTHCKAECAPLPNLIVEAGHAEYHRPAIQKIISIEYS